MSAKQGCNSCMILRNSYLHIKSRYNALEPEHSTINFQIPVLDEGFPLGLATSDDDGWYSWDEIFTEVSAAKLPWLLIGQATERKETALESISVLKGWIETCQTSHPHCAMQKTKLPTRVLDVQGDTIALRISDHQEERYAALSHCWGKLPVIQTHRSTFADRIIDIPWASLSKTFQDAVTTTRLLGLRYLWIDSLCIVQDDPEDWARESGSMASIYNGAQVVIAASDSSDGHDGFFRDRPVTTGSKTVLEGTNADGDSYKIKVRQGDDHRWYGNLLPPRSQIVRDSSPLFNRGWAFQERLLATRYAQFRSQELVWECRTSLWCECGTLSRPSQQRIPASKKAFYKSLRSRDQHALYSLWSRIVNTYASKALTNSSDILPALSGLAKRFQESGAGDYLAGLWREDLPLSLLWEAHGARADPYRAPSWSWASIDTSITGSSLIAESTSDSKASAPTKTLATVNTVFCESSLADPTGRVTAGRLTITGQTVDIIAIAREVINGYESPFDCR
ncbi:heterokaryon incompatibility protein-domain-containing protein [Rhexocercosporidium sp. MPI-PUGE-AT-0058]|nr:heterokaryon incompatibility protein-domain-containing protein [Rhexocercosporidium sp. MPI-PUGE-AT-0058]